MRYQMVRSLYRCFACFFLCISISIQGYADERSAIGVVYPQVSKPYQEVFDTIIEGIRRGSRSAVETFAVQEKDNRETLNQWLVQEGIDVVIALGKQGLEATERLPEGTQRILGAVLPPLPENIAYAGGIFLAPDPDIIFKRLRQYSPNVNTVTAVYDPAASGWLLDIAAESAKQNQLELKALPASDLRQAAQIYSQIIPGLGKTDAIWLLNDPNTVDDRTILPELLKASWSGNFVVVSNNPAHVKRGVLFALYPDYVGMGQSLGQLTLRLRKNGTMLKSGAILPLTDVLVAFNTRTAEHLELELTQKDKNTIHLLFPPSR